MSKDKYTEAKENMEEISKEREKLKSLGKDIDEVRREIQDRLMQYLKHGKNNFPNLHSSRELIEALSGLFKTQMDISDRIMRSYEKSIELNAKYVPSAEGEDTPYEFSFEELIAIKRKADKETKEEKQKNMENTVVDEKSS